MKTLIEILSTVFLTVGAVVGAGFISGRELLSFFGADNFSVYLLIVGIGLSLSFFLVFYLGGRFGSLGGLNARLFKTPKLFGVAVNISCFISSAVMLSALDEITKDINPLGFPVYSLIALIFLSLLSRKGVKGARIINCISVPLILIAVNLMIFLRGKVEFSPINGVSDKGLFKALLYITMNIFMNLPSLVDGAQKKSKPKLLVIATLSAVLLAVEGGLILGIIRGYGKDLSYAPLPFLTAVSGGKAGVLFSIICLVAVFNSLTTAYYPLYNLAREKSKDVGGTSLAVGCFIFSRLGVKRIIDFAYPVIGGFGAVYISYCTIFLIKEYASRRQRKS